RTTTVLNPVLPLQAGSIITVDDGANQETVVVKGIQFVPMTLPVPPPSTQWLGATIIADFKKTHNAGFKVYTTLPGNPGPMTSFNPDSNSAVVPFYTILDGATVRSVVARSPDRATSRYWETFDRAGGRVRRPCHSAGCRGRILPCCPHPLSPGGERGA